MKEKQMSVRGHDGKFVGIWALASTFATEERACHSVVCIVCSSLKTNDRDFLSANLAGQWHLQLLLVRFGSCDLRSGLRCTPICVAKTEA